MLWTGSGGFTPFLAFWACLCLAGCLDSAFLDGKDCDDQERCIEGYVCDTASGTCVRPGGDGGDPADGAGPDGGPDGPDGDGGPDGADGDGGDPAGDFAPDGGDPFGDPGQSCPCPDCNGENFICIHGPQGPWPLGPPGVTVTVRLDGPDADPGQLVCVTQNERLVDPQVLFRSDFESGFDGFGRVVQAERRPRAQSILSAGSLGAMLCYHGAVLETGPIDTTGKNRIQVRYAAVADLLEDSDTFEFLVSEYSPDGGQSWFVLDVQGDGIRDADWQWFNHILPGSCQGISDLRLRFQIIGSDYPDDCAYLDDVSVLALPEPTVSRTLMSNRFEESEGNQKTGDCLNDRIVGFAGQTPDARVCLTEQAQNPESQDPDNRLGVRLAGRGTLLVHDGIETNHIPAGSDVVAGFSLRDLSLPPEGYANAWYRYRNVWYRMGGVGVDTAVGPDQRFRFVWDRASIGLDRVQLSFWIPDTADGVEDSHAVAIDDFDVSWHRASHDVLGTFRDQGDGRYLATLQSDLPGRARLTCIFYGNQPPLVTDGSGINSSPFTIDFE